MTDRELMQMALDVLEKLNKDGWILADFEDEVYASIEALRARLAQPEQEPVTMVISKTGDSSVTMSWWHEPALPVGTPLYTASPQREWQGLTDEEIESTVDEIAIDAEDKVLYPMGSFARAIEAKLKEKNSDDS